MGTGGAGEEERPGKLGEVRKVKYNEDNVKGLEDAEHRVNMKKQMKMVLRGSSSIFVTFQ